MWLSSGIYRFFALGVYFCYFLQSGLLRRRAELTGRREIILMSMTFLGKITIKWPNRSDRVLYFEESLKRRTHVNGRGGDNKTAFYTLQGEIPRKRLKADFQLEVQGSENKPIWDDAQNRYIGSKLFLFYNNLFPVPCLKVHFSESIVALRV